MRIPEITKRLREIAEELGHEELAQLADELPRRAPVRRAPVSSRRMTPELSDKIRQHAEANPTESYIAIGRHFDVNPGRVSEIMAGFRA